MRCRPFSDRGNAKGADPEGARARPSLSVSSAARYAGMHVSIGIPPHITITGIPIAIIALMAEQRSLIIVIWAASVGIILQTMPSLVISAVIRHIIGIGIIMGIIIGIPMPIEAPFMPECIGSCMAIGIPMPIDIAFIGTPAIGICCGIAIAIMLFIDRLRSGASRVRFIPRPRRCRWTGSTAMVGNLHGTICRPRSGPAVHAVDAVDATAGRPDDRAWKGLRSLLHPDGRIRLIWLASHASLLRLFSGPIFGSGCGGPVFRPEE